MDKQASPGSFGSWEGRRVSHLGQIAEGQPLSVSQAG